jgi:Uma2 family endonuclease
MTIAPQLHYDYAEYEAALEASRIKLEFCDGVIYAMAGGTPAHAELAAAMIVALRSALPRSCRIATSDKKVRVEASNLTTFPDVSVVCGESVVSAIDRNAVVNPTFLVEVTSKSTEEYDRGDKLGHYRLLPTLRAVLFVSHRSRQITVVERDGAAWTERDYRGGETVALTEHGARFTVDEVYEDITLDPA